MIARRSLSTRDRARIFAAHSGICHLCKGKIVVGEAWDVSHDTPLEMGGADDDTNMMPAHRKCHRKHTAEVDVPMIARAKRREAKHTGSAAKRSKFPGARTDWRKRKVGGGWVNRETGEPL